MAHYAFLDKNNIVVEVITGKDEDEGIYDWEQFYGQERRLTCKRTSYNTYAGIHIHGGTPFRKNYAGIGFKYDSQRDAFIPPQPYPSWQLDEFSCCWQAPTPMPADGQYYWDESQQSWMITQA